MLLTDTYAEIIRLKARNDLTWQELAERIGTAYPQNVMDAAHRGKLPDNFIKLAEVLGADVEIVFKPRPMDPKEFCWKISKGRK